MELKQTKELAVAYVRMSTEHQKYSTANQLGVIEKYANEKGLEIKEVFHDDGKSGASLDGRNDLKRLFEIVNSKKAEFKHILVYDVSRWGRFQDPDEGAYYEFQCKRAGLKVHYCAEMFPNDGSLISTLTKGMKRVMAGEYLRELSSKVLLGQCNLIRRGFKQSGFAGYGLRRALIDEARNFKGILGRKQWKSITTDRVILVRGPEEEVENVKWIYRMFTEEHKREKKIAEILNKKGIKTDLERDWTPSTVKQVLTNEKYIGNSVFNKRTQKIQIRDPISGKKRSLPNPKDQWVRYDNAFDAIVDKEVFYKAQSIFEKRRVIRYSDEELLDKLRNLFEKHGKLNGMLINETRNMPSSAVYSNHFGSLVRAYELVGYTPERNMHYIEINNFIRNMHVEVLKIVEEKTRKVGATFAQTNNYENILINNEIALSLVISRCRVFNNRLRWIVKFERDKNPDFTVAIRLNPDNKTIHDYYVISRFDMEDLETKLGELNGFLLDSYRYDNIDWLYSYFARIILGECA